MEDLCRLYKELAAQEKQAKDEKYKVQNQLRDFLGTRKKVEIGDFSLSSTTIKKEGFWVNPASYRNFSVTQRKPKEV